jgi:hypothetical protein
MFPIKQIDLLFITVEFLEFWIVSLQHFMVCFLAKAPASEVYRASIEHKFGLSSQEFWAMECRGQTRVQSKLCPTSLVNAP